MTDITDLSEYREGWRDMPEKTAILVESIIVRSLASCLNVPDRVERLREILDRANLVFESADDLVEFIKKESNFLEIDDDHFVMLKAEFVEQALQRLEEEEE